MGQRIVLLFKIDNNDDYNNFKIKFNKENKDTIEFLSTKKKDIYYIYLKFKNKLREKEIKDLLGYYLKYLIDDSNICRNGKKKFIKAQGEIIDNYVK